MRTLGPREGLRFSRPSSLAAIGPVPRMYASRAAFGSAARRLAECAERVPAHARIAVLVVSDGVLAVSHRRPDSSAPRRPIIG